MDFDLIPIDVWIEIFSVIDDPHPLAILSRTCQRFRALTRRPLLKEIKWLKPRSTQRNIDAWSFNPAYNVPRKATVGIPFEFGGRAFSSATMTPETQLHDKIWEVLPRFTSLHTLILQNTVISVFSYTVIALIPSLRHLVLTNCIFISLPTSFTQHTASIANLNVHVSQPYPASFPFSSLPLTHLEMSGFNSHPQADGFHPMNLVAARSLTHLSLEWTGNTAQAYHFAKHSLPSLTHLSVSIQFLYRDLTDELVAFVERANQGPLVDLTIERHNITEQQLGSIVIPIKNVCSYVGPLSISSFSSSKIEVHTQNHNSHLTSVRMNNYPVDLAGFLEGVERLPKGLRVLEVMVRKWDCEMLFAVRELFRDIEEVVIRYGRGVFAEDFFVTLGANILYQLPKLSNFKLYQDDECLVRVRATVGPGHGHNFNVYPNFNPTQHATFMNTLNTDDDDSSSLSDSDSSPKIPQKPKTKSPSSIDNAELKDYLLGWNRYCTKLRRVQLREDVVWERRWEGDMWTEKVVEQEREE